MKKSLFIFIAVLIVIPLLAQNNIITYTANAKLEECTSEGSSGLHVNAFNVSILSHDFSGTTGTITFSGDVTSIGDYAFHRCYGLTSITIPENVTNIGHYAFYGCRGLTSITIPENVTNIGAQAFDECSFGLVSIVVESGNTKYDSRNNCNAIIETASNELIVGCKNTIIPNSVTRIRWHAFSLCTDLTSITIPEGVTSIGYEAFSGCYGLTSITIPESVTSIGDGAFSLCFGLESIVVASGNTKYDSRNNCNAIIETASNELIVGCKNTIIPNSVTSIGDYAFYYCYDLTSITIPESVTSIGHYAFYNCSDLSSITIPESVTSIGNSAFYGCRGLTSLTCLSLTPPSLGSNVFALVSYDIPLYVHASAIPAYEAADQWNEFDIQPLHVEIAPISPDTTNLTWLPVDSAAKYQLHIYSNQTAFDTTLLILANPDNGGTRLQTASSKRQHRIVLGDEIGTLVVIVFDDNTGTTTDEPFVVSVSTTSDDKIDIHYDMRVLGVTDNLIRQESGMFTLNDGLPDAIEKVYISSLPIGIYDLYGHRYPTEAWESLPAGVYVVREDNKVEKMMKR